MALPRNEKKHTHDQKRIVCLLAGNLIEKMQQRKLTGRVICAKSAVQIKVS